MEIQLIRKLVRLMTSGDLSELEVDDQKAGLRVHLRRGAEEPAGGPPVVHVLQGGGAAAPAPAPAAAPGAPAPDAASEAPAAGTPIPSPLVGTFYRASSPDADPFVEVGARVVPDSVICIVEAMKVMNEIKAETRGEIVEVLVENGEPVEFGQPLFLVKPD